MTSNQEPDARAGGALAGIRVIDVTSGRSGPTCTRQLADMGADVIHVVRPAGFELRGSDAWNLMRNKRSIQLDLKQPDGRDVLLRLLKRADVFVENWRPEVKRRLQLDPDTVCALNPRLIYASISGFGQTGPYADRPALDQIIQGMSGLMSVTGPPDTQPWRVGIAISDLAAGTFLAQAITAALFARERSGRGQWVHTSLLESMINLLDFQATRWLVDGERPMQEGNNHPTLSPMGTFPTSDGWLNIAVVARFDRFCERLGAPQIASDPRFSSPAQRARHRIELDALLAQTLQTRSTAAWVDLLAGEFPCGPVLTIPEVFHDPQVRHLRMTARVPQHERGSIDVLRSPVTFSATPQVIRAGAPTPGADTDRVLRELGLDPEMKNPK